MTDTLQMMPATFGTVILDGSGNGTVRLAPIGTEWHIDRITVKVNTRVLEAKCYVYWSQVSDLYLVTSTLTGSTGDTSSQDNLILTDGTPIYAVWQGGDVGATATLNLGGRQLVPNRGFRV